jgi:hypothetical protein
MAFTTIFNNLILDASDINTISLHSGPPGTDGTANEVSGGGYSRQSCTFGSANNSEKALTSDVIFSTPANQSVTHIGFWASGTFRTSAARTSGDATASAGGAYKVGAGTKLTI